MALYGATSGEAYFRGVASERFAVRNSGALAVVEGVGDHGCEYMTGGRIVILGRTGRNFAAGMSGGIAYVFDPNDQLISNINLELVEMEPVENANDIEELKELISSHANLTGSVVAKEILDDWETSLKSFKRVIPTLYRTILEESQAVAAAT